MSEAASVLVTGGAGYIGSHAVLELREAGYRPVVLDDLSTGVRAGVPQDVPFHEGDVADAALTARIFREHDVRAILHFAGSIIVPESVAEPVKYYKNNTMGTLLLVEAALKAGVPHFIFSSTAAVYGVPDRSPINEDAPTRPINPYGWSKLMSEQVLRDAASANEGFRPVCLRYFNVAGADPKGRAGQQGPNTTHLVRVAVEAALGDRPILPVFGQDYPTRDGTCERDYIHVTDLAAAHIDALRYLESGGAPAVFNCGYGSGHTVLEVIAGMEAALGRKLPVKMEPRRSGDSPSLVAAVDRIRSVFGWQPRHDSLSEIVGSALAWQEKLSGRARSDA